MKYKSGIDVHEGHIVLVYCTSSGVLGVVLKIIKPDTEDADDWSLPEGGVIIEGGGLGLSATKSLENDEDVIFIRRC